MERNQAFRVTGTTTVKNIAVDHVNGHDVIFWEDIDRVFPTVNLVQNGGVVINMLRDASRVRYEPLRIKHRPDVILDVVLTTAVEGTPDGRTQTNSTLTFVNARDVTNVNASVQNKNVRPSSNPINMSIPDPTLASQPVSVLPIAEPQLAALTRGDTENIEHEINSLVETIDCASQSGQPLGKEHLTSLLLSLASHARPRFERAVIHGLRVLHDQGATTQQITVNISEQQTKANDRSILIQKKTEAILTQQVELAEYPIPRLFIVLPEEPKQYNPANWFRTKFRLHFICECGEHTQPAGSKVVHHLHLAKHEGYPVREPTAFFKKYGPFLKLMLELIKVGSTIAGHVVPALATLKVIELVDSVKQSIDTVAAGIDYSLECIDKEMEKLRSSSLGELGDTDRNPMTHQDLANYLNNVEGLEGVELRQLGSFLRTSNADNLLGNLYRMTTADGHVKWVCRDHYRAGYQEAHTQRIRDIVKLANGRFDEQLGTVEICLLSKVAAKEFFNALVKAKDVVELVMDFNWECTKEDIELLRDSIEKSAVAILRVDLQHLQPRTRKNMLLPKSNRYQSLYQILEPVNLKSVHLVLPQDIIKRSNFTPVRPLHLRSLVVEVVVENIEDGEKLSVLLESNKTQTTLKISGSSIGEKGVQAISEAIKTNPTLTTLDIGRSLIKEKGADILSEALKSNRTLTTLNMENNTIGEKGAKALSEALKSSKSLTTLNMENNAIGEKGAKALSEALKSSKSLTTLNMENNAIGDKGAQTVFKAIKTMARLATLNMAKNLIGEKGAQELSEALKSNRTLTTLNMANNPVGERGAQALSEALKSNRTLTTLNMENNAIGDKGAQTVFKAIKTMARLATLNMAKNLIGEKGAQELFEALKTNTTLTTLNIAKNSIGVKGAQALSEALKTNSTLTTLNMANNSIGKIGTQALSKALKTNTTLTTLDMGNNSIGETGARELAEALSTISAPTILDLGRNSTLTTLKLNGNAIGGKGAQALSTALMSNSTLTTLDLRENSIGKIGAQALSEALKTNSTLTTLRMKGNAIKKEGILALSEACSTNTTLTTLEIDDLEKVTPAPTHTVVALR